jgi:hypothetical protein
MRVGPRQTSRSHEEITVSYPVQRDHEMTGTLWFSVPVAQEDWISPRLDGAMLTLLIPAMRRQEPLHLDGLVTDELFFNARTDLQQLLIKLDPTLRCIDITVTETAPLPKQSPNITTAFSGGIDSFSAIGDFFLSEQVAFSSRVSHLVFFNVGSHGQGGEKLFRDRFLRLAPSASRLGLPFVSVNSNMDQWYEKEDDYQKTHVIRSAATIQVLQQGIGRHLHASTYQWRDLALVPNDPYYSSRAEPLLLSHLSTGACRVESVGASRSRVDRVRFVSTLKESHTSLDVCTSPIAAGNCSRCVKCQETMLTLDLIGLLDQYDEVFDVNYFNRKRGMFLARTWSESRPHDIEIQELCSELGVKPSLLDIVRYGITKRARSAYQFIKSR